MDLVQEFVEPLVSHDDVAFVARFFTVAVFHTPAKRQRVWGRESGEGAPRTRVTMQAFKEEVKGHLRADCGIIVVHVIAREQPEHECVSLSSQA